MTLMFLMKYMKLPNTPCIEKKQMFPSFEHTRKEKEMFEDVFLNQCN